MQTLLSKLGASAFMIVLRWDDWKARRMVRQVEMYLKLHSPR